MSIAREIEERYRSIEKAWLTHDARHVCEALYNEQVCIQGDAMSATVKGLPAAIGLTEKLMEGVDCVALSTYRILEIDDCHALTSTLWILYSESANFPGVEMKSQSLWKKTAQGWCIEADMRACGEFGD